jgi:hypothetical protein
MTKRKEPVSPAVGAGNASSPKNPGQARPWTDDEMRAAKPLPLPTVGPTTKVPARGVPHAGKGETNPAGQPESDDEAPH